MVRQDWSDDDLAQRLHERDPEALETLISRYSRELFYFIRLVLDGVGVAQDAEECVNDLFVAVWQEIDSFDPTRGTLRRHQSSNPCQSPATRNCCAAACRLASGGER